MSEIVEEVSATIKAGTGHDSPWIVVRGTASAVERTLRHITEESDLVGLTANAAKHFQTIYRTASSLGATVIETKKVDAPEPVKAEPVAKTGPSSDPWEDDEDEAPAAPVDPVLAAIAAAQDKKALQDVYTKFPKEFSREDVIAAAKARAGELAA